MQHSDPAQCIQALRHHIGELEQANEGLRLDVTAARTDAADLLKRNERLHDALVELELPRRSRRNLRSLPRPGEDLDSRRLDGKSPRTDPPAQA